MPLREIILWKLLTNKTSRNERLIKALFVWWNSQCFADSLSRLIVNKTGFYFWFWWNYISKTWKLFSPVNRLLHASFSGLQPGSVNLGVRWCGVRTENSSSHDCRRSLVRIDEFFVCMCVEETSKSQSRSQLVSQSVGHTHTHTNTHTHTHRVTSCSRSLFLLKDYGRLFSASMRKAEQLLSDQKSTKVPEGCKIVRKLPR